MVATQERRYLAREPHEVMRKSGGSIRAIAVARVRDLLDHAGFDADEFHIVGEWANPDEPRFRRVPRGYHRTYVCRGLNGAVRVVVNPHEAGKLLECLVRSRNGHNPREVHRQLLRIGR